MSIPLDINEQEIRERCAIIISAATDEAARMHHNFIGTEHLYNALTKIESGIAQRLLIQAGFDPRHIRNEIRREAGAGEDSPDEEPPFTPRAYRVLAMAVFHADDYHDEIVSDVHVLLSLLQEGEGVAMRKLAGLGISLMNWIELVFDELAQLGESGVTGERAMRMIRDNSSAELVGSSSSPDRIPSTPLLDKYGRDLTELARQGKLGPAIGRDREIQQVARTLTRNKKNNPLLLGDAGVGKTAVIEGLAWTIINGTAPTTLLGKRIVQIEIGTLLAGTSLRGQFEERLVGVVEEAKITPGIILFIDEIHTIVGAGDTIDSNLDAANILKPALSRGEIICIGATTHEEYRKAIAQDAALDRRFRIIDINEPSVEETLQIVKTVQDSYARHHKVVIQEDALQAAVSLSSKYMINRRQPDKSLDLLDEACARVVIQTSPDLNESQIVTAESIAEVVAEWTGIPISELTEDERLKYNRMDQDLQAVVVGQDHAVVAVADAIKTNRAGLSDPNRPVGVFLFLGPSGVGKTELAKALAKFLFGSEEVLLRFDMSEFHDEHTVARLIGSPPGYKDSQRGGQLTEALRRKPYSVVLLDEVEKAAPEVFDIFLQVFDEGRLSDARGGTVDARHAVWIMTSNIGTAEIGRAVGFTNGEAASYPDFTKELKRFFRPEFLNRLDEVIIFNTLNPDVLDQILDIQLRELVLRLQKRQLKLTLDRSARDLLIQQGYDPRNGARLLRRTIERLLTRPLSNLLLGHHYPVGTTINVRAESGALVFEALRPTSPMHPVTLSMPPDVASSVSQVTASLPAQVPASVAAGHSQHSQSIDPKVTQASPLPPTLPPEG
ncbi:MAG: ATP-dependent Clp protease ATP-binding subunit [Anaerolineae bacterium]|nr:ATP-dependent Clp protease ATP-binding subunit [Anaerolineae bacterium]